jgi:hypothetical protein
MSIFYLNVRNGDDLVRDPEAYAFPNAQAARDAAARTVRELVTANPEDPAIRQRRIEIADATGHAISVVDLHDAAPELCDTHEYKPY